MKGLKREFVQALPAVRPGVGRGDWCGAGGAARNRRPGRLRVTVRPYNEGPPIKGWDVAGRAGEIPALEAPKSLPESRKTRSWRHKPPRRSAGRRAGERHSPVVPAR